MLPAYDPSAVTPSVVLFSDDMAVSVWSKSVAVACPSFVVTVPWSAIGDVTGMENWDCSSVMPCV